MAITMDGILFHHIQNSENSFEFLVLAQQLLLQLFMLHFFLIALCENTCSGLELKEILNKIFSSGSHNTKSVALHHLPSGSCEFCLASPGKQEI